MYFFTTHKIQSTIIQFHDTFILPICEPKKSVSLRKNKDATNNAGLVTIKEHKWKKRLSNHIINYFIVCSLSS